MKRTHVVDVAAYLQAQGAITAGDVARIGRLLENGDPVAWDLVIASREAHYYHGDRPLRSTVEGRQVLALLAQLQAELQEAR